MGWLSNRLPADCAWLFNDVPACRGLAVAWLKRGASASVLKLGVPATVLACGNGEGYSMAAVMIGVDPHKASRKVVAGHRGERTSVSRDKINRPDRCAQT